MSLRARILALFLGLGVVPILLLGILGYARSMRAVRGLLEAQTSAVAHQAALELRDRWELRLSELLLLAENAETQRLCRAHAGEEPSLEDASLQQARSYLSTAWERFGGSYRRIDLEDLEGRSLVSLGGGRAPAFPPGGGMVAGASDLSQTARLLVPITDVETGEDIGTLEAAVRLGSILPVDALPAGFGRSGYTVVLDRRDAEILHHPSRRFVRQPLSALLGPGSWDVDVETLVADSGSFSFREADSSRVASFVSLEDPPWTVVSTAALEEFTPPFQGARRWDLLIVLVLAALVGGGFLVTTRRATASLQTLTVASEQVGRGDLYPALPPSGPDEVGRLSTAFSLMVGQVREMLRRVEETRQLAVMGEFASSVSHRIRNPLTSIKLNLQGLSEEARSEGMSEDSVRSLGICLREVAHLEDAVKQVLDMARTHPPMRVETSVHQVISESVELLQAQLSARDVRVVPAFAATEDRVLADPGELQTVFVNLLVNAQEAMPGGGTVRVRTDHPSGTAPEVIRVQVTDEGPGVPAEVREQIFRPFVTTKSGGTGFGLAIARLTVQDHGGWIRLDAPGGPGEGASFTIELPLHGPAAVDGAGVRAEAAGARKADGGGPP